MMKQTVLQQAIKKDIGDYCKSYRTNQLGMTLIEFADEVGANYKTISSFENGRSTNMFYMFMYTTLIKDNGEKLGFVQGLNDLVDMNVKLQNDMRGVHHD